MSIRILVVEDDRAVQTFYRDSLESLDLVCASSADKAREAFADNPDFAAIVMDGCVLGGGKLPNTLLLTQELRKTFPGPMIAASGDAGYRTQLVASGCDYESPKESIPQKLCEILGLR